MEKEPTNDTPYKAAVLPFTIYGAKSHTIMVKGTFQIMNGASAETAEEQLPFEGADAPSGESPEASARYESDFVPFKPKADVLCVGKAYAPEGRATTKQIIRFRIGPVDKMILITGNRYWDKTYVGLGARISAPEPFTSMDVSYENAYGGKEPGSPQGYISYPLNPVGKGYVKDENHLHGVPLPNLEDPNHPVRNWWDPAPPVAFGPVGRYWTPRIQRAGTYDQQWLDNRAPEPPEDFDPAYYNCAPADQQIKGYLHGDETLQIDNMHPDHPHFQARLPGVRVRSFLSWDMGQGPRLDEIPMNLDTLWVDMEALLLVLVWRGRLIEMDLDSDASIFFVEESLDAAPLPPERYQQRLAEIEQEDRDTEKEYEEAEMEVGALEELPESSASESVSPMEGSA